MFYVQYQIKIYGVFTYMTFSDIQCFSVNIKSRTMSLMVTFEQKRWLVPYS